MSPLGIKKILGQSLLWKGCVNRKAVVSFLYEHIKDCFILAVLRETKAGFKLALWNQKLGYSHSYNRRTADIAMNRVKSNIQQKYIKTCLITKERNI